MRIRNEQTVWNKRGRFAGICLTGALTVCLGACVPQTDVPIIAERTKETAEGSRGGGGSESAELEESYFDQDVIRTMTEAPDRYQAQTQDEFLQIRADAPLEVPAVGKLFVLKAENSPYEQSDCEAMLERLKAETGVKEWRMGMDAQEGNQQESGREDEEEPADEESVQTYYSEDGAYSFSFGRGMRGDRTPMLWLKLLRYRVEADVDQETETELTSDEENAVKQDVSERKAMEKSLVSQAEQLMRDSGLGEFRQKSMEWRQIRGYDPEVGWKTDSEQGLYMVYEAVYQGISLISGEQGWASEPLQRSQYVNIFYRADGTLLEFKNINRERVSEEQGTIEFLLPFSAVSQIFEQYMKYYQSVYDPGFVYVMDQDRNGVYSPLEQDEKAGKGKYKLDLEVTRIRFAWQMRYDGWNAETQDRGSGQGRLVPVWAFYGTPRVSARTLEGIGEPDPQEKFLSVAPEDRLLLLINAEDGTVYGAQ